MGPDCMKACHPLKRTGENITIIIKFVYFNDKHEIYGRRKKLAGQQNIGTQMYFRERLSKADTEIIEKCNQWGPTSKNCVAKFFLRKNQKVDSLVRK